MTIFRTPLTLGSRSGRGAGEGDAGADQLPHPDPPLRRAQRLRAQRRGLRAHRRLGADHRHIPAESVRVDARTHTHYT